MLRGQVVAVVEEEAERILERVPPAPEQRAGVRRRREAGQRPAFAARRRRGCVHPVRIRRPP